MHAFWYDIYTYKLSFPNLLWKPIGLPDMRSMNHSVLCVCVSLKGHCELFISESIGTEHNCHLQVEVGLGLCQYFLIMNPACALHSLSWISRDPSGTRRSAPFPGSSVAGFVLFCPVWTMFTFREVLVPLFKRDGSTKIDQSLRRWRKSKYFHLVPIPQIATVAMHSSVKTQWGNLVVQFDLERRC